MRRQKRDLKSQISTKNLPFEKLNPATVKSAQYTDSQIVQYERHESVSARHKALGRDDPGFTRARAGGLHEREPLAPAHFSHSR